MYKITWCGSTGTVEDEHGSYVKTLWDDSKRDPGREYSLSEARDFYLRYHPNAIIDKDGFWKDIQEFWTKNHEPREDEVEFTDKLPLNSWEEG